MDNGFRHSGFAAKGSTSNPFEKLRKFIQVGADYWEDTILQLDSLASSSMCLPTLKGTDGNQSLTDRTMCPDDGSSLVLSLWHRPKFSDSKVSSTTGCTFTSAQKNNKSSAFMNLKFQHLPSSEKAPSMENPPLATPGVPEIRSGFDLNLSPTAPTESDMTISQGSAEHQENFEASFVVLNAFLGKPNPIPAVPDLSSTTMITTPKSSVTCTSGLSQQQQRNTNAKKCKFRGCGKGARGASGLCIAHGGGRRCQKTGCHKGAEGRTVYCKAHGGGRRCQYLGCTKSAEGRTDYCIAHGGGRRCSHQDCTRAARGKSGLCIRHGGGKRCQKENCARSAEGLSGLCISHGGGRRCQFPDCSKGAQGSTMFCKAHGGGKRCTFLGCTKGAEGSTQFCKGHGGGRRCSFLGDDGGVCPKSVHGGTQFCVAHGGGKRCAVAGCTKSARGRTDFCVRHGGGKKCKYERCGKSAQGSTDFCKAHGGGKRCSWASPPCDQLARGKAGLCVAHRALVQDQRVHGAGTLGSVVQDSKPGKPEKMKEMDVEGSVGNFSSWDGFDLGSNAHTVHLPIGKDRLPLDSVSLPEGRVHGGSLLAMLSSSRGLASGGAKNQIEASTSGQGGFYMVPHKWM